MEKIRENVIESFRLAKRDIISLQRQLTDVSQAQGRMMEFMARYSKYKAKVVKSRGKTYVASELSNKFHIESCPFAHNIKSLNKLKFRSKKTAFGKGFKPCECVI